MPEERKVVHISIRFRPEVAAQLKTLARKENRSINGTVHEAVERYLRQQTARRPKETVSAG